jgi:hypothetical protein
MRDEFEIRVENYKRRPPTQADANRLMSMGSESWDTLLDVAYVAATTPREIVRLKSVFEAAEMTPAERAIAIKECLERGETHRVVSLRFGISRATVSLIASGKHSGYVGARGAKGGRPVSQKGAQARELLSLGKSIEEVAEATGMNQNYIRKLA